MKNVLITGGCGFIGVNLAAALTARGVAVTAFDDESLGKRAHLDGTGARFVKGDILDADALDAALEGADTVVHLAADTRVMDSIENPQKNFEVNAAGSFGLLQAMRRKGVRRIVSASTGGAILGEAPSPVHEEMVPRPLSPYGASKLAMEGYHSAFAGAYGMDCACLRFSNVFGPRSFHKGSVVAAFYRRILKGEPITVYGDGTQVRDYVHVSDIVDGIVKALEAGVSGVYQLGSGKGTDLNALIETMRRAIGPSHPIEVRHEPFRDGEIHTTWCDVTRARGAFGYDPATDLEQGLAETWRWFLARDGQAGESRTVAEAAPAAS